MKRITLLTAARQAILASRQAEGEEPCGFLRNLNRGRRLAWWRQRCLLIPNRRASKDSIGDPARWPLRAWYGPPATHPKTVLPAAARGLLTPDRTDVLPGEDLEEIVLVLRPGQVLALLDDANIADTHLVGHFGTPGNQLGRAMGIAGMGGVVVLGDDLDG